MVSFRIVDAITELFFFPCGTFFVVYKLSMCAIQHYNYGSFTLQTCLLLAVNVSMSQIKPNLSVM